jgi:hypothetical protein
VTGSVLELRQYTLRPRQRDTLIELFDTHFVESQEEVGIEVLGQFRDTADPDRFVWLRAFPDMESRARSLADFYYGPVWRAHRDKANPTMLDSDDVLLLRPAAPGSGFAPVERRRDGDGGAVEAAVLHLEGDEQAHTATVVFEETVAPQIAAANGTILGYFRTETSANTFPALPVRDEHVFVWFASVECGASTGDTACLALEVQQALGLRRSPQTLRLDPTRRSLLRGGAPACSAAAGLERSPQPAEKGAES